VQDELLQRNARKSITLYATYHKLIRVKSESSESQNKSNSEYLANVSVHHSSSKVKGRQMLMAKVIEAVGISAMESVLYYACFFIARTRQTQALGFKSDKVSEIVTD